MRSFVLARAVGAFLLVVTGCDGAQSSSGGGGGGGGGSGAGAGTGTAGGTGSTGTFTPITCDSEPDVAGKATYYDFADGSGACSFDPTPDDLMVGAMNAPDYLGSAACGACAAIDGPNGDSIVVRIVDLCPECESGHIDLSPEAFGKLADLSVGVIQITWRYVSCDHQGPIQYKFKEGSNQWWTAVQLRRHANRIAKFEYEKDGTWVEVPRLEYNYFVEEQGMGPGPYHFRVTDVLGQVLEDEGIGFVEGGVVDGKGQFAACVPHR